MKLISQKYTETLVTKKSKRVEVHDEENSDVSTASGWMQALYYLRDAYYKSELFVDFIDMLTRAKH